MGEERAAEARRMVQPAVAVSRQFGELVAQPALAGIILNAERGEEPANFSAVPSPPVDLPYLRQRLPFIKEFNSAEGDWLALTRRFITNQDFAGWTEAEALRALPAALDDVLAAFLTIPPAERAMLQQALAQMAAIYGLPSNVHHRFTARRQREPETLLAFRSALLVLAKAAFPKMNHDGLHLLVLEKLLALARNLHIIIQAIDEDDLCSLKVARCIQANLLLQ
ncbi:unnamed protein product [Lampetra planeri]